MEELQKRAKKLFRYYDGILFHKISKGKIKKGQIAGCETNEYCNMYMDGKFYRRHQIVFLIHHGFIPKVIDHIDRDTHNDRIGNLRGCTQMINCHNRSIPKDNTTGYRGVVKTSSGKFYASIMINYKRISLGSHDTAEMASEKYEQKLAEYMKHSAILTIWMQ